MLSTEPGAGHDCTFLDEIHRAALDKKIGSPRGQLASLPFDQPKLMAVAQVNEQSFAELLERRLNKIEETRLIEAKPCRIK